ncbi:type II secretion system protein [Pandoraea commovens]|uniref:type II secretion system protein n=1 Tax=Pandoraea commovens TaxID=2508289 RepID=UPI00123FE57E|nr:prepilin-type N-terminal cleavage/methylation domain-containing protein [Pandoraea commovens]
MGLHTISGRNIRQGRQRGFTLIELLVVMAIVGLLMSFVAPAYFKQTGRAQETVLRHNLRALRTAIDDYRADRGEAPASLDVLVQEKYLKEIPLDPVTGRRDTWKTERGDSAGVLDVHSGSPGKAADGTEYAKW